MVVVVTVLFAAVGFLLSAYAYFIKRNIAQDASYKPAAVIGMIFYGFVILFAALQDTEALIVITLLGLIAAILWSWSLWPWSKFFGVFAVKRWDVVCILLINVALLFCTVQIIENLQRERWFANMVAMGVHEQLQ